jgi:hypothetical protein
MHTVPGVSKSAHNGTGMSTQHQMFMPWYGPMHKVSLLPDIYNCTTKNIEPLRLQAGPSFIDIAMRASIDVVAPGIVIDSVL